jgi:glycosyltransferase involved in cell wall biosynthesis
MNIAFISEYFPPYIKGGAEISTSFLVKFVSKFHTCIVIRQRHQNKEYDQSDVKVYPILEEPFLGLDTILNVLHFLFLGSWFYPLINFLKVYWLIQKEKIDLIHIVITSDFMIPIIFAGLLRHKPILVDLKGGGILCPAAFAQPYCFDISLKKHHCIASLTNSCLSKVQLSKYLQIFRYLVAWYRFLVFKIFNFFFMTSLRYKKLFISSLSEYTKKQHVLAGIPKERITVIYNMVYEGAPKNKKLNNKRIVLGARLLKEKGVWDVVKAIEMLHDRSIKLVIAGIGPEFDPLSTYVSEKNLNNIKLIGRIANRELLTLYARSKIIIAASIWPEPFGRFIQESISTRTPCIATAVGGIPEGIRDRETGIIVKPNSPESLAKAVLLLLTDKKLYRHIQDNLEKEEKKYSPEMIGKKRLEQYEQIVST